MSDNLATTQLNANTSPALTDIVPMVDDPSGSPETQKVTLQALADLFRSDGPAFIATASGVVANTTSETTVVGTGSGSLTLASGFLTVGKTLRMIAAGIVSTTGTPTLTLKFKLGSTVVLTSGAITMPDTITNKMLRIEALLTCRATGGSGSVFAQGVIYIDNVVIPFFATVAVTIATNTSQAVGLTAQWSAADSANTLTISNVVLEKVN